MMKARSRMKKTEKEVRIVDIYIQMIIDEALFKRKKHVLEEKINEAIDSGNQPLFYELANEYSNLLTSAS